MIIGEKEREREKRIENNKTAICRAIKMKRQQLRDLTKVDCPNSTKEYNVLIPVDNDTHITTQDF